MDFIHCHEENAYERHSRLLCTTSMSNDSAIP
jgi:hypothetical protein